MTHFERDAKKRLFSEKEKGNVINYGIMQTLTALCKNNSLRLASSFNIDFVCSVTSSIDHPELYKTLNVKMLFYGLQNCSVDRFLTPSKK